ncbi:hypothetical protein [Aquamicrobium sp. LC103]|uniref:hypothetical protein n=1 Tax=Aquamicrobium sp. LC103 TaxID=1120658 RepID=UPI0006997FDC|nr:hypothetical protein [Aquamicrobium sp. LC103]TKT81270.1 hypothetical protein XW59_005230 [Aquamicrobium sp. LC103]
MHAASHVSMEVHAEFERIGRLELRRLADELLGDPDPVVVDRSVRFVLAETRGLWHGRARAKICRRLKHHGLGRAHRDLLVACILRRLSTGAFSEQFKDQLRLAMQLDPGRAAEAGTACLSSPKPHVRRYARWVLGHADG